MKISKTKAHVSTDSARTREDIFQLQRDFKFHLGEQIDISGLTSLLERGNSDTLMNEISRLRILYAEKVKAQAETNFC